MSLQNIYTKNRTLALSGIAFGLFFLVWSFLPTSFVWHLEGNISLTADERAELTAIGREFEVQSIISLNQNKVLAEADTSLSMLASVMFAGKNPTPETSSEVLLETTSGEVLLIESAMNAKESEMIAAYQDLSFIANAEENLTGSIFVDTGVLKPATFQEGLLSKLKTPAAQAAQKEKLYKTKVAILDSGIDAAHPAFAGNLWQNPAEKNGRAKVDDDHNGFADDISGWNFTKNSSNVNDTNGHGTHIAGIIGAKKTVYSTMQGIDPDGVELMILKVAGDDGTLKLSDVISALKYAANEQVDVVNMSFGFSKGSDIFHKTIADLAQKNIFLVAAAGNSNSSVVAYPAAYSQVLAVGATAADGSKWATSNYGDWVDVSAPAKVLSTLPGKEYGSKSGTSQAAALMTGMYAYYKSTFPAESSAEIQKSLARYATQFDVNTARKTVVTFPKSIWMTAAANILESGRVPNRLETVRLALNKRITVAEVGGFLTAYAANPNILAAVPVGQLSSQKLPEIITPDIMTAANYLALLFSDTPQTTAVAARKNALALKRLVKIADLVPVLRALQKELAPQKKSFALTVSAVSQLYLSRQQFLELVFKTVQ